MLGKFLDYKVKPYQSGNIMLTLFGAVVMVGALGTSVSTFMTGPLQSSVKLSRNNVAQNQMLNAAKIAVMASASQEGAGDCDADGFIEPLPWRDKTSTEKSAPVGGGYIPDNLGAPKSDPFGNLYGYCVWDSGPKIFDTTCGGETSKRLRGGATDASISIAIISAGNDRIFQTTCNNYVDAEPADGQPDTELVSKPDGSDDIIVQYTYAEASGASSGLWKMTDAPTPTATIGDRNIEVGGNATFTGQVITDSLNSPSGVININNALRLPDESDVPACTLELVGATRYNSTLNMLELCKHIPPSTYAFVSLGGVSWPLLAPDGTAAAPSYSFQNSPTSGLFLSGSTLNILSAADEAIISNASGSTDFRLKSGGGLQIGNDTGSCTTERQGTMRYDATEKKYQFCDGTKWAPLATTSAVAGKPCVVPGNKAINNGEDLTFYQAASVAYDSTCVSQVRTCEDGSLSGSYTVPNCTVAPKCNGSIAYTAKGLSTYTPPLIHDTCLYTITVSGGVGYYDENEGEIPGRGGYASFKFKPNGVKNFTVFIGGKSSSGGDAAAIAYDGEVLAVSGGGGGSGSGSGAHGGHGGAGNSSGTDGKDVSGFYEGMNNAIGAYGRAGSNNAGGAGGASGYSGHQGASGGSNGGNGLGNNAGTGNSTYMISGGGGSFGFGVGGGAGYGGGGGSGTAYGGGRGGGGGGGGGYIATDLITDLFAYVGYNSNEASVTIKWEDP